MRVTVRSGAPASLELEVPGDKSIAHRWLLLATTGDGASELRGLPAALDVRSTARLCATLLPSDDRVRLERWASNPPVATEGDGSTRNEARPRPVHVRVEGGGRRRLEARAARVDCGNSGTTMRLGAGVLASVAGSAVLQGDASLSRRPMERIARPLREMGASVTTVDGHPPVSIAGGELRGIDHVCDVPSAQVKGAVLLAGLDADGRTTVHEPAATRDHTERALAALGAPVEVEGSRVRVGRFQHAGFQGHVPGDVSSAAFLAAAAALTGGSLEVRGVGLNPSRTRYLDVMARMGVRTRAVVEREELGEPVGTLLVEPCEEPVGVIVAAEELPLVIDEVPILAVVAACARGPSRFEGAGELRVKESDRLSGVVTVLRALGADADVEGDDLVVVGGELDGGEVDALRDHRIAMAAAVAGAVAPRPVTIHGADAADVSFPGFFGTLARLGVEVEG